MLTDGILVCGGCCPGKAARALALLVCDGGCGGRSGEGARQRSQMGLLQFCNGLLSASRKRSHRKRDGRCGARTEKAAQQPDMRSGDAKENSTMRGKADYLLFVSFHDILGRKCECRGGVGCWSVKRALMSDQASGGPRVRGEVQAKRRYRCRCRCRCRRLESFSLPRKEALWVFRFQG
jgi:hypothetical protein